MSRLWPLIEEQALAWKLDPCLLEAVVMQESSGNPLAQRFEPAFRWLPEGDLPRPAGMNLATERAGRMTSYGLTQVMGQVARERGFTGWWGSLFEPALNLHFGSRHLAWCLERYRKRGLPEDEALRQGLARYNGGGNPDYPGQVLARAAQLKKERA